MDYKHNYPNMAITELKKKIKDMMLTLVEISDRSKEKFLLSKHQNSMIQNE